MKKAMTLGFLLSLAIGMNAQSRLTVPPNAHVPPSARAANSTVPPVAQPGPVAVRHDKKK